MTSILSISSHNCVCRCCRAREEVKHNVIFACERNNMFFANIDRFGRFKGYPYFFKICNITSTVIN